MKKIMRNITDEIVEYISTHFSVANIEEYIKCYNAMVQSEMEDNKRVYFLEYPIVSIGEFDNYLKGLSPQQIKSMNFPDNMENIKWVMINPQFSFLNDYFETAYDVIAFLPLFSMAEVINTSRKLSYAEMIDGLADYIDDLCIKEKATFGWRD